MVKVIIYYKKIYNLLYSPTVLFDHWNSVVSTVSEGFLFKG